MHYEVNNLEIVYFSSNNTIVKLWAIYFLHVEDRYKPYGMSNELSFRAK